MSQTKTEFILERVTELLDKVIERESIPKNSESYADLGYVKFYVRDLAKVCKGCAEGTGDQNETDKNNSGK